MQTTIPKIASVLLTVAAVAFMGLSVAAYYGRPNPVAEMSSEELSDFNFQVTTGAESSWTVTPSVGADQNPQQSPNAYAAVLSAYENKSSRMSGETDAMNELTAKLRDQAKEVRDAQEADHAALEKRIGELEQIVQADDAKLMERSRALQELSVETLDVRKETTKRREDVTRLQSELDELRTDTFRLEEIRRVLTDRLLRIQLENQDLELRLNQLTSYQ